MQTSSSSTIGVAPAAALQPKATFSAWWMLGILFLLYVFSFLDRYIFSMLVTPIKTTLQLSEVQMGLILGPAFAVCYAVCGIPLGWSADRFSRRWVIFLGTALFGLATALSGLTHSFVAMLIARMCVGIGEAALSPAAHSLLADRFPRRQLTTALSIYTMGIKIGSSAAFAIGGVLIGAAGAAAIAVPLIGELESWRVVLLATGAPAVLLAFLVFTFKEPPRTSLDASDRKQPAGIVRFLKDQRQLMLPLLIGFTLVSVCSSSLNNWVPSYLSRHFGWQPAQYGALLGAISMVGALSVIVKGMIVDWLYSRGMKDAHLRFYTWILLASLPAAGFLFFVRSPVMFLVLYGIVQIVAIPIIAYMSAALQLVAPGNLRGRITAVFLFCITVIGVGLGPMITAAITEYVFRDANKVGYSLAVVTCTTLPIAWLALRSSLPALREAVTRSELKSQASHPTSLHDQLATERR